MRVRPSTEQEIINAVRHLVGGNLVVLPTETVYGIAADATNESAVQNIYALKGRPSNNPLIIHVSSMDMASEFADITPIAHTLAKFFWPGPLTMVLRQKTDSALAPSATANLDTVAIRYPAHPAAQAVIRRLGRPIAAPSANPSGTLSPTKARHVDDHMDKNLSFILDGGPTKDGVESTIITAYGTRCKILRPGTITPDDVSRVLEAPVEIISGQAAIEAPGMMTKHYAPQKAIRLNATDPELDEGYLAFGDMPLLQTGPVLNLSPSGDLREAAEHLFDYLHQLDQADIQGIAVAPIPIKGIGLAINDRLQRAAAKDI